MVGIPVNKTADMSRSSLEITTILQHSLVPHNVGSNVASLMSHCH